MMSGVALGETRRALPFKIGFTTTIIQPTTLDVIVLKYSVYPFGIFHPSTYDTDAAPFYQMINSYTFCHDFSLRIFSL